MAGLGASIGVTDPYTAAIQGILGSVGQIAGDVPEIAAAFGQKSAATFLDQQQAIKNAPALAAAQAAQAQSTQWLGVVEAAAPYVALTAGLIVIGKVVMSFFEGRSKR